MTENGKDVKSRLTGVAVDFGEVDRQKRLRGWSDVDLAKAVGIWHYSLVRARARGRVHPETLRKIVAAFVDNPPLPGMDALLAKEG